MKAYTSYYNGLHLGLTCMQGCLPRTIGTDPLYHRYRMNHLGNRAGFPVITLAYAVRPESAMFLGTGNHLVWLYYSGEFTYKRLRQQDRHESL